MEAPEFIALIYKRNLSSDGSNNTQNNLRIDLERNTMEASNSARLTPEHTSQNLWN